MEQTDLIHLRKPYASERLELRSLKPSDLDESFLSWFQDEELMRFYTNSRQTHTRESLLANITQGIEAGTSYVFAIVDRASQACIGTIKLGPINHDHKISDLVVLIGDRRFHGQGLAVDAIRLGNAIAFEEFGIRKLFGGMFETNQSSYKAYTRAGWVEEGRLKGHYLVDDQPVDRLLVACFNPTFFPEYA
ncbi:Protein N-acetyltransferase, RimJ/RimL family [Hymenobacter daecheongensis DSM 21074]|uniref:Protein N-acetyltransferase, RimJ/RimL family n=1 Tax=Hymenobacter daecheongensis DSM 21074 TaxID=1121955 RepID=A0A1M6EIM8_9BACT|nr:GNAT family N-acetyltransferase [Hymenobacter daecheongensis]SHI85128.1 Protein N-acetyltransferase, RimJ/RimL family [Hymenobacter daecheongensis DSM 21074]